MKDLELKEKKQAIEAAVKADQLRVEEARIAAQKEIAAMQTGASAAAARDKLNKTQEAEGVRMGVEIAKHKAQLAAQQRMQLTQRMQQKPQPKKGNE
jgi:hypothetical protein